MTTRPALFVILPGGIKLPVLYSSAFVAQIRVKMEAHHRAIHSRRMSFSFALCADSLVARVTDDFGRLLWIRLLGSRHESCTIRIWTIYSLFPRSHEPNDGPDKVLLLVLVEHSLNDDCRDWSVAAFRWHPRLVLGRLSDCLVQADLTVAMAARQTVDGFTSFEIGGTGLARPADISAMTGIYPATLT